MPITIPRKLFMPGSAFMRAAAIVAGQSWGGQTDAKISPLHRQIRRLEEECKDAQDEEIRKLGRPDEEAGGITMRGASREDIQAFDEFLREYGKQKVSLDLEERIILVRRKAHTLPPSVAAELEDIFEVKWPDDDGSELDKKK